MRRLVVDGNFTAQHMNMREPELDICLSDGSGYMVTDTEYQAHLASAMESKEVRRLVYFQWDSECVRRGPHVATIEQSMQQMQTEATFELLGWVPQLALGTDVLFPTR
jgi:hypothetical protein